MLFITAEIGINANGSLENAKKLIDMAAEFGCDAVKFQKRDIDSVYKREFLDSPRESPWGKTQRAQKEGLEFNKEDYDEIDKYCKSKGIEWYASAWDLKSHEFLKQYDLKYNKISSAMLTSRDLVTSVAGEGKHTFISTGMSTQSEIRWVVDCFRRARTPFTLMHCVSTYPCDDEVCNLKKMQIMRHTFHCPVGYSGHERGIVPSLIAVSMGATAIERHITLDRASYGSDQAASLEKRGLEILTREARNIEKMMGDGNWDVSDAELEVAGKLRYWEQ